MRRRRRWRAGPTTRRVAPVCKCCFRCARADQARGVRLCIPQAGWRGSTAGLLEHLHKDRPIYGLQDPHVVAGEPRADRWTNWPNAMWPRFAECSRPGHITCSDGRWVVQIAHAMAVRLQRDGESVGMLAMLDSAVGTPEEPAASVTPLQDEPAPGQLMADLLGGWRELFDLGDEVRADTHEQAWAVIRDQVTGTGMFTPEQADRVMESFETASDIAQDYRPEVFDGDLVFFTAGKDRVDHDAVARRGGPTSPATFTTRSSTHVTSS